MSIFQLAGAKAVYVPRCPTISKKAEALWQKATDDARATRNSEDLPAWCGIFCYYIYRCAGVDLGGWINHNNNMTSGRFRKMSDPAQAFKGCIGVEDGIRSGGRNHHFIVMQNSEGTINSIDGNSFGPINGDFSGGVRSVIAPKTYSHQKLKQNNAYFLFPNLS